GGSWMHGWANGDALSRRGRLGFLADGGGFRRAAHRHDDAEDAAGTGQSVFTEIAGALLRGVRCEDKGNVVDLLPPTPENPHHPRTLWQERIFIDPMQTYIYDGCSNIFFPIHTSGKFATEVGLPGIIVQGTAVLAHAVRVLINREVGGDSFRLKILYGRFSHMVFPGTEIIVQLQGAVDQENGRALHFDVVNDRGQKALSDGYAFVKN
ncbi:MAG: MaoC/PaaZ C-terminal domain-containing protein, partial [Bacteroidales bacterium]